MEMNANKTKNGIYEVTAQPIIDLEKEIDDRYTQIKRPRFLGLGHKKTVFVPNDHAPRPKMSKLGLIASGAALFLGSGCAGSSSFTKTEQVQPEEKALIDGLREYSNRLDEIGQEYGENARKIVEDTIKKYENILEERKDQAHEKVIDAIRYRQFVREIEGALDRYEKKSSIVPIPGKVNKKDDYFNKDEKEKEQSRWMIYPNALELYSLQRRQDKGHEEPRVVNGLGAKLTAPIGKGFNAYIKLERDEKDKEVANSSSNVFMDSKANTYGAGFGYNLIDTNAFKLDVNTGLFLRDETNKINGVNGISVVDEKDNVSYLGAEAAVNGAIYLGDNFGICGHLGYENHNILGRLKGSNTEPNTKAGYRVGAGIVIRFGPGK